MNTNPVLVRKIISVISVLFGGCWCWAVIYPLIWQLLASDRVASDYFFISIMVPLLVIPGVLAIGAGIILYRAICVGALKFLFVAFACLGVLEGSRALMFIFPHRLAEQTERTLFLLIGILVVIPLYVIAVRKTLELFEQEKPRIAELLGRGTLVLIAWQVWLLLNGVSSEYPPLEGGQKYFHKEPWQTLGVLIPIIVAYGGYKLAAALLSPATATRKTFGIARQTPAEGDS